MQQGDRTGYPVTNYMIRSVHVVTRHMRYILGTFYMQKVPVSGDPFILKVLDITTFTVLIEEVSLMFPYMQTK